MESMDAFWANDGRIYKPSDRKEEEMLKTAGYRKVVSGLGEGCYERRW